MRRVKITVAAVLLAVCWFGLRTAAGNELEGISVARQGDSIAVAITTSADCQYNVFLTEDKPERIVIDLSGVVNNLPKKQFANLPLKSIKSIRTSQYKSAPDPQARVVLDIHRPVEFTSLREGNEIMVKLSAVPEELAEVNWSSSGSAPRVVSAPPADEAPTETPSPTVVQEAQAQEPEVVAENASTPEVKPVERPAEEPQAGESLVVAEKAPASEVKSSEKPTEEPAAEEPAEKPVEEAQVEEPVEQPAEEMAQSPVTPEQEEKPIDIPDKSDQAAPVQRAENTLPVSQPMAVASPTSPGTEMDATPKRKIIDYKAEDEKDPFVSLVGLATGKISGGLPSLENLKLVGVLEDEHTSSALLEDGEGNGYILKPNDRIQNGYLLNVSEYKATFQITEYGWTRTVALELQVPKIK